MGAEVIVPTGNEELGFGGGSTIFEPYISWGKMLPADSFFQMQALLEFPTESGFEDAAALRAALGRTWTTGGPFGRAWTPMIEVLGSRDLVSGADIEWDVVPQFQVTLNTRQHVSANFGLRIPTEDGPGRDTQFVFYLLVGLVRRRGAGRMVGVLNNIRSVVAALGLVLVSGPSVLPGTGVLPHLRSVHRLP